MMMLSPIGRFMVGTRYGCLYNRPKKRLGLNYDEAPTLAKLHNEFMPENNFAMSGKYPEIYLGDPRKVKPEK